MIKHIHLDSCDSTQSEILEYLPQEDTSTLLLSTEMQTKGIGRLGNEWIQFENSLAFSFTLEPAHELTLTPLEIGVLLIRALSEVSNEKLFLKWPNDILNQKKEKIGGIIINNHKGYSLIVGIGINLGELRGTQSFNHFQPGGLVIKESFSNRELCLMLTNFIIQNRLNSSQQIIQNWQEQCLHYRQEVRIHDKDKTLCEGTFMGVGEHGEALIETPTDKKIERIYSGSLSF